VGFALAVLLGVIIAVLIFGVAVWWVGGIARRRWGVSGAVTAATAVPGTDLEPRANELLLQADDAVKDAEQEVGFIEAQFGLLETKPLREALAQARTNLAASFKLRQQLDDAQPESDTQRQRMLAEIAERAGGAIEGLQAAQQRVQSMRDVQSRAPELLTRLPDEIASVRERIESGRSAFTALQGYAETAWESVQGNIDEASKNLQLAEAQLQEATAAGGDARRAGKLAQESVDSLAAAVALVEAVERTSTAIKEAEKRLTEQMIDARTAVAAAKASVQEGNASGLAARLTEAEQRLAAAEEFRAAGRSDPLAASRQAALAIEAANAVVAGAADAAQRREKELKSLDAMLRTAEEEVRRASDYINVRRKDVQTEARARLAEAERNLEQARSLQASQPGRALENAKRAEGLALSAYTAARADFTITKTRWGGDEPLTAGELLRKFAAGEFGRKRR